MASCQQENEIPSGTGYLSVEGIELQSQVVAEVASRAVDESLTVDLYEGGQLVRTLTPEEMQNKIELEPATDYMLKVHSANYGSESAWNNETKGEPVYYKEVPFEVIEGATTALKVKVPMITFAVCLNLTDVIDWLKNYTFSVTSGNRTVTLQGEETAYFPYSEGASFSYQLSVTNWDDETNEQSGSWGIDKGKVEMNTLYTVTYNWATQALVVTE